VYGALAGTTAELASATKDKGEATRLCRDVRAWSQKSLDIWAAKQAKGTLSASDKAEVDSLVSRIAKCPLPMAGFAAGRGK
jgi:hypothetical protein